MVWRHQVPEHLQTECWPYWPYMGPSLPIWIRNKYIRNLCFYYLQDDYSNECIQNLTTCQAVLNRIQTVLDNQWAIYSKSDPFWALETEHTLKTTKVIKPWRFFPTLIFFVAIHGKYLRYPQLYVDVPNNPTVRCVYKRKGLSTTNTR